MQIKKAFFSAVGFGVRFLTKIKIMPKELLLFIDKLLVQIASKEVTAK